MVCRDHVKVLLRALVTQLRRAFPQLDASFDIFRAALPLDRERSCAVRGVKRGQIGIFLDARFCGVNHRGDASFMVCTNRRARLRIRTLRRSRRLRKRRISSVFDA